MKYLLSDFYFLHSAAETKDTSVGGAYKNLCTYMGVPVPMPCLLHALRVLRAAGYITFEPDEGGMISEATPLSLTPEGKAAVAVSFFQKLFGEYKAHQKLRLRFCEQTCPDVSEDTDLTADEESFRSSIDLLIRAGDISHPMLDITDLGEGFMRLTVHHPNDGWSDPEEDEPLRETDPDAAAITYSASVTGTAEQITAGLRDLIDTAYLLVTEPPRPRKAALHGGDGSLLIALANAANEQGMVTFRMTVSRIRFNRGRFVGKRDSDLDYAQCGDPVFVLEMSDAVGFCYFNILQCAVLYPDLLTSEDHEKLSVILRETNSAF